ncbi:hypothetical protein L1887_25658 [Cichorium endivia]|nr:hypothetical protein L1887_25658 [Cichorium endivia]
MNGKKKPTFEFLAVACRSPFHAAVVHATPGRCSTAWHHATSVPTPSAWGVYQTVKYCGVSGVTDIDKMP